MDKIPPDDQLYSVRLHKVVPGISADPDPTESVTLSSNEIKHHKIPTWTAYNSLLTSTKPLTDVNALPLILAPAHEWQTLITVLKQTQQIKCMVMGYNRKTTITLDVALFERAKQFEMSRDDFKDKQVLRLGEMHTAMAALRAAGNAIEDTGLEEACFEADINGVESQ